MSNYLLVISHKILQEYHIAQNVRRHINFAFFAKLTGHETFICEIVEYRQNANILPAKIWAIRYCSSRVLSVYVH